SVPLLPGGGCGGPSPGAASGGEGGFPPGSSPFVFSWRGPLRGAPEMGARTRTVASTTTHHAPPIEINTTPRRPRPWLQSPITHRHTDARTAAPDSDTSTTVMVKLADGDLNHAGGLTPSFHARISAFGHSLGCGRRKCQPNMVT